MKIIRKSQNVITGLIKLKLSAIANNKILRSLISLNNIYLLAAYILRNGAKLILNELRNLKLCVRTYFFAGKAIVNIIINLRLYLANVKDILKDISLTRQVDFQLNLVDWRR